MGYRNQRRCRDIAFKTKEVISMESWKDFKTRRGLPKDLRRGGAFSLDPQEFDYIINLIQEKKIKRILELGAGVSTVIFALELAKTVNDPTAIELLSIEGDLDWFYKVWDLLRLYQVNKFARVCLVEYKPNPQRATETFWWFDKPRLDDILNELDQFDMLLVDAPIGTLCEYARFPAIPFLLPFIKENASVLLHDAKRRRERHTVTEWSKCFKNLELIDTKRGLAVFTN